MADVPIIPRPKLNKVPGGDVGLPQAKEIHKKDLTKLTQIELLEIKEREGKLLANKSKLSRLPDKGKRIQDFYDKVNAELERRSNVEEAAAMFSQLNIASKGQNALNKLEWSGGNLNAMHEVGDDPTNDVIDSDDEIDMDPLRIIAKASMHERKVKIVPDATTLITADDLAEIATFNSGGSTDSGLVQDRVSESTDSASETSSLVDAELIAVDVGEKLSNIKSKLKTLATKQQEPLLEHVEQHVRYLVTKTERQVAPIQREKFKPYKTTISDVHAVEKERTRKKGKNWEITAATPPPIKHKSSQMLPLLDSVQIQETYLAKMRKLQEEQAVERLAARVERLAQRNIKLPSEEVLKHKPAFTTYRSTKVVEATVHIEGAKRFNEDDEVHDTLDDESMRGGGGVTYTVYE